MSATYEIESREEETEVAASPGQEDRKLIFNVSGQKFEMLQSVVESKYANTLLGSSQREEFFRSGEYFFNQDPNVFRHILTYYTTGQLHLPRQMCIVHILSQLNFFGIGPDEIADCCYEEYTRNKAKIDAMLIETDICFKGNTNSWRQSLGKLLYKPHSSIPGMMYHYFATFILLTNILANIIASNVELYEYKDNYTALHMADRPSFIYRTFEIIFVGVFSVDFLLRVLAAIPKKRWLQFFGMAIVDLLAIIPFFVEDIMIYSMTSATRYEHADIFSLLKVFRLLKLYHYSAVVRILCTSLVACAYEVWCLVVSVLMANILFASLIFYAEAGEEDTMFHSVESALWYTIVTTTTVGYGDISPYTRTGKQVASVGIVAVILVFVLASSLLVSKFLRVEAQIRLQDRIRIGKKKSI